MGDRTRIAGPVRAGPAPARSALAGPILAGCLAALLTTGLTAPAQAQVTFEEVLAAPDDPDLNLAYVRQEIDAGRLQSASSTLARMLLTNPDWDAARLAYGIVLYRLQDNLGAIREFVKLEDRLSGQQESDRVRYLRLAQNGERALTISGSVALGARIDSNPAAIANDPAVRGVTRDRDTDGALTAAGVLRAEYDLGGDPGATAFATVRGSLRDYFETDSSDISDLGLVAGGTFRGGNLEVSVFGTADIALQDEDLFRRTAGFGTSFAYDLANGRSRTRYLGGVSSRYESFDETRFTGIAEDRDGWRTALDAGVQHFFTDAHRLSLGVNYARKNARNDGFSYDRFEVRAGYLALLGQGVYSDTNASWANLDYDTFNGFQTNATTGAREDRTWRVRTVLGAPLETIFAAADIEVPSYIGDFVLQGGVTYTDRSSNVDRYDFDNVGADLLLIKRFQF